ncbi:hypothetical protein C10C_0200 [Chlamydia serpentis]|uniref:Uncharacterized protein n=1 Tax=Chlamydia serpentis TaxID=1967782 RepID=A0A2R8FAB8_9CHLA|nr:hypothetical protein [Chlamydia serpentis]SPN73380.1 hypothetical protein C10C_0200 [Chlamydia serpentis]
MSLQPLIPLTPVVNRDFLTKEEKIDCYQKVSSHLWRGAPAAICAAILLVFCIFGFILGAVLLGAPLEGVSIINEVILPWLVPSVLVFILIVLPLNIYAYSHHKEVLALHKRIAESNYNEAHNYCEKEKKTPDKKVLSNYIESKVLIPEYSKRFSSMILGKTLRIIPNKNSSESSKHDGVIQKAIERAKESIYMNKYEKEKRNKREIKKEEKKAKKLNS